ncbi:MAG: DUF1801 domain-containing protein [Gammaproteobacteria bacterium]|nr:DUF1801 domain-containing protein [Gammaproteobacteria bacterium]MDH5260161.1 DUF1801 domain-containing protein [Gammaproteobacteria bacterium]MDH5411861.1 DUF1801 domain-containing protein [Alphaproteobacteria bacterium]MDH5584861.1 DUF1801 domain-containing protein [Gammaproteobacteria bacterium]
MAAENKTKATKQSVATFLNGIDDKDKRADAKKVAAIMQKVTGEKAAMWGSSIVGFGQYHYKYESGREGDFMLAGFAPRKKALTIYIMAGFKLYDSLMKKLGKYKTGKSCLYVERLSDIDEKVLTQLIDKSVQYMRKNYETR